MAADPDLDRLRIRTRPPAAARRKPPRHAHGERFLKGPIPWNWITVAMRLEGKALAVGVAIWFQAGLRRTRDVTVSMSGFESFGVTRASATRGLAALERAGLVAVDRQRGRKPRIHILDAQEPAGALADVSPPEALRD